MKTNPMEVVRALVHQVSKASAGKPESEVVTYITRPLWGRWCEELGLPANSIPTPEWTKDGNRVYGSQTIIVESENFWSASFAPSQSGLTAR